MGIAKRIEIPDFPAGKRVALTFSFDDGVVHDRRVVEFFNERGLRGTFNLNSGKLKREGVVSTEGHLDASEIEELFRGHEVAVHTVTHPHLPKLDVTQIVREVMEDRIALEDLVAYPVRGLAYPFGTYNQLVKDTLRSLGFVYARTVENKARCFPPEDPMEWGATMHHYNVIEGRSAAEHFEHLHGNPRWSGVFFVWGHTYEFPGKNDWEGLERLFAPMAGHEDVWYCTNIELFDYEAARRRVVIAANRGSVYNPSGLPVWVSVDGELVEVGPGSTVSC